jgi:hypothetical protein
MSLPPVLSVSPAAARAFMREALLLNRRPATLGAAIDHHGYIQIDPINVCGRMHDLILRPRVAGYQEGDLVRHLHGTSAPLSPAERVGFEHHLPSNHILVAFALDAWPHLLTAMSDRSRVAGRWSGRLTPREKVLATRVLAEIGERGPLSSDGIVDSRSSRAVWGSATLVKTVMQKLFFHGRLLIAAREKGRRKYDLPERVLPPPILARPAPPASDTARWLAQMHLRQRRLVALKRADLALVEDLVQPVQVTGAGTFYCLSGDAPLFGKGSGRGSDPPPDPFPTLLAPLDPLIYDRKVTQLVWNFDYTWEAYTPAAKRRRGYYAMPLLQDLALTGHVDSKADRPAGRLRVVSRSVKAGSRSAPALKELASFLGLRA